MQLRLGMVFSLYQDPESYPRPKPKIGIIVGFDQDKINVATVYINTERNLNFGGSPELEDLQIEILPAQGIPCIRYKSYIDCSDFKRRNTDSLAKDLDDETSGRLEGNCSGKQLARIRANIARAISIKPVYKKMYGFISDEEG